MNREELVEKFEELEQKWKPESLGDVLNIFNIGSTEELSHIPQKVDDVHNTDWKLYCRIRRELADMGMENEDTGNNELNLRFLRFQENIFYGRETILCFMRMTICNSAFPVPASAELLFWNASMNKEKKKRKAEESGNEPKKAKV